MARRRSIDLDPMLASQAMGEWEQQQERAFVGWVNSLLRQHPSALTIDKLDTAFADGVALINQSAFPRPFAGASTAGGGTGGAFMSPMYTALLTSSA